MDRAGWGWGLTTDFRFSSAESSDWDISWLAGKLVIWVFIFWWRLLLLQIKSRRQIHAARVWGNKKLIQNFYWKSHGKRPWGCGREWEYNIKIDYRIDIFCSYELYLAGLRYGPLVNLCDSDDKLSFSVIESVNWQTFRYEDCTIGLGSGSVTWTDNWPVLPRYICPFQHRMALPQVANGGVGLQIRRVAANILNK
jgi:hypothetical protein